MSVGKDKVIFKTSSEVVSALRLYYPADRFALLTEVGDSTGFKCKRHCDALVMSLWPSRGLDLYGVEVKVSRTDWLREIEKPEKAEAIAKYCDYWFLAVGNKDIVKDGELPPTWGLLVPDAKGSMRCSKEATKLTAEPLTRNFIASMMRQTQSQLTDRAQLAAEFNNGIAEGRRAEKEAQSYVLERELRYYSELKKKVDEFEKASGVMLNRAWSGEKIGAAVQQVMSGAHMRIQENLLAIKQQALRVAEQVDRELTTTQVQI